MTISLKHRFISGHPDGPDATLVRPTNWNDEHNLTGTPGTTIVFDGAGNATEVPSGASTPGGADGDIQFNDSGTLGGFTVSGAGTLDTSTGILDLNLFNTTAKGVVPPPASSTSTLSLRADGQWLPDTGGGGPPTLVADTTYYISNYSGTVTRGSGYVHAEYFNKPLTTFTGIGSGATADFVVKATGTITAAGSGYTPGIHPDVPLTNFSGSFAGTGMTADITVGTSGPQGTYVGDTVTAVYLNANGTGYVALDVLKVNAGLLGGALDTFRLRIDTVGGVEILRPLKYGSNYAAGDELRVSNLDLGGAGSGFKFILSAIGSDSNPGTSAQPWRTLQFAADQVSGLNQNNFGLNFMLSDGTYDGVALGIGPYNNWGDGGVTSTGGFNIYGNTGDRQKVHILGTSSVDSGLLGPCGISQTYGQESFFVDSVTFRITITDGTGYGISAQPMGFSQFHRCRWTTATFLGSITNQGTGYTPGTYLGVALNVGGSGTGAKADIIVNSLGKVTNCTLVTFGSGYVTFPIPDVLSSSLIGGGVNFAFTLATQAYSCIIFNGDGGQYDQTQAQVDGGTWRHFMEFAGSSEHYFINDMTYKNVPVFSAGILYLTNDGFLEVGVPTRSPVFSFYGTCTGPRFALAFNPSLIFNNSGLPTDLPGTDRPSYRDGGYYDGTYLARNGFITPARLVSNLPPMPNQYFAGARLTVSNALAGGSGTPVTAVAGATVTITGSPGAATVNWTGHGLAVGTQVVFSTTVLLPPPLAASGAVASNTIYYVIAASLGANSFQISDTPGGTAVALTSAGAGTHTAYVGRTATVLCDGVTWRLHNGLPLTADTTYYVTTSGSNSNPGTSLAQPWATIQFAADFLSKLDFAGFQVTLQLGDATTGAPHAGANFVGPYKGRKLPVLIKGNLATPGSCNVTGLNNNALGFAGPARWEVGGVSVAASGTNDPITTATPSGIAAVNNAYVGLNDAVGGLGVAGIVDFRDATASSQIYVFRATVLARAATINGNATWFADVQSAQLYLFGATTWNGTRAYTDVFHGIDAFIQITGSIVVTGTVTGRKAQLLAGAKIELFSGGITLPGNAEIQFGDVSCKFTDNNFGSPLVNWNYNYQAPAVDGFNVPMGNMDWILILNPGGTFSTTGTVTLPASPSDGQLVAIRTLVAIPTFTLTAAASVFGAPSTLAAGGIIEVIYKGSAPGAIGWYCGSAEVGANTVSNVKLADMAQSTIKGRAVGAGTGDPTDLTSTQATAILDNFNAASNLKGLVPNGSGNSATVFLNGQGAWTTPGGSGNVTAGTLVANAAVYATGATSIASTAGALTDGQILIGRSTTGGPTPVAATLSQSTAAGVSIANGPGSITLGVTAANEATDTTCFPAFFTQATGDVQPKTNASLTYNSNTGAFSIGTTAALTAGSIELGNASDTTITRSAGGTIAVEGQNVLTVATGSTISSALTNEGAVYATGTGSITSTGALTNGQILIGSTPGAAPVAATITGTANQITVTNGAGSITLSLDATDIIVPAILTVPNTGLHLADTGGGQDLIIKPGTNLTADRTLTVTTADSDQTLTITGASVSISGSTSGTNTGDVDLSTISGTLAVNKGGTGATTLTDRGVLVGHGTGAVVGITQGTDGQILLGKTGALDPAFGTMSGDASISNTGVVTLATVGVGKGGTGLTTSVIGAVLSATATNNTAWSLAGTSGQILHSAGSAVPTWGAVALASEVSGILPMANIDKFIQARCAGFGAM